MTEDNREYAQELRRKADRYKFGNLLLSPMLAAIANTMGALFNPYVSFDRSLKKKRHVITGYLGKKLTIYEFSPRENDPNAPALLFFHGGAFLLKGFGHSKKLAARYAKELHASVFFVDYHLAYKYLHPHAIEDAYSALVWLSTHVESLKVDPNRIAVCGDSAGGYLAAALAHLTKDRNGPRLLFQTLVYPVLDASMDTPSMKEFIDTPVWNSKLNRQMCDLYFRDDSALSEYTHLLKMDCRNLPEAYIEAHQFDCLRDEALMYSNRMQEHGSEATLELVEGSFHGADIFLKTDFVQTLISMRIAWMNQRFKAPVGGVAGEGH